MSSKKSGYKVRDLVIDDEYSTIGSQATVREAAEKMKEVGVPDLVVLNKDDGKVLGVIADFDIVHEVVAKGKNPNTENVRVAMYSIDPVTLDTPVEDAFVRMRDLKVTVVPVVHDSKLLGVCTIHDVWSYIPPEGTDKIGLIPVTNSRLAEFWLSCVCGIAAFILGLVLPMAGVFGYFTESGEVFPGFRGSLSGSISFYLFGVHGNGTTFSVDYFTLGTTENGAWILMLIMGFALLAFSIIGAFSLAFSGYAGMRGFHVKRYHLHALPLLMILFMVIEWIFLAGTIIATQSLGSFQVDPVGVVCSIIAIGLIILAMIRDRVFVQKKTRGA